VKKEEIEVLEVNASIFKSTSRKAVKCRKINTETILSTSCSLDYFLFCLLKRCITASPFPLSIGKILDGREQYYSVLPHQTNEEEKMEAH
jgi:hypothetical protein